MKIENEKNKQDLQEYLKRLGNYIRVEQQEIIANRKRKEHYELRKKYVELGGTVGLVHTLKKTEKPLSKRCERVHDLLDRASVKLDNFMKP